MTRLFSTLWPALFLPLLLLPPSCRVGSSPVSVEKPVVVVEVGHTAEITCSSTEGKAPLWFRGHNATDAATAIPENSSLRVWADAVTGKLTVREAAMSDKDTYTCRAFLTDHSVTVDLRVYRMPSYVTEGVALAVTDGALVLILAGGLLIQFLHRRRKTVKAVTGTKGTRARRLEYPATEEDDSQLRVQYRLEGIF